MTTSDPQPWEHLGSTTLFDHPRVQVIEEAVRLPSGHETTWLSVRDGRDYVKVVCADEAGRVLVSRQYVHPPRRVVHEFPGGVIERGETPEQTARRELAEEVGLAAREVVQIGAFLTNNRRAATRCVVFAATGMEQRPAAPDHEEIIAYEWLDAADVDRMVADGTVENAILLACWAIYRLRNK
jgi:8-oxo-dGTP pyrophosphatase MutT (NUDIX family)